MSVPTVRERRYLGEWSGEVKRLLVDGSWVTFGQGATALALLATTRLLTELVTPEVFGTVSLLLGTLALGRSIFCTPILQGAVRFYPDVVRTHQVGHLRGLVLRFLVWTTGGLLLLILIGGGVYSQYRHAPYSYFLFLAGLLVLDLIKTVETSLLTAARRQRPFAIWTAVEAWSRPLLAALLIPLLGSTPQAVLLGYIVGSGLVLLGCLKIVRREGVNATVASGEEARQLAADLRGYVLPLMPLALVSWVSGLGDRYIIGGLLGTEPVGLYAATYGLVSTPFIITQGIIEYTLRPPYFNAVSQGDEHRENRIFRWWFLTTGLICGGGIVAVILLKNWCALLLLGSAFRSGTALMPWIALGYTWMAFSYVFYARLYAYKKTSLISVCRTSAAVVAMAITFPLVLKFHLAGAAWACTASNFLELVVAGFLTWGTVGLKGAPVPAPRVSASEELLPC